MAKLIGAIQGPGPVVDKRLENKLFVLATTSIPEDIKRLLAMSFWGVAEQLESDGLLKNLARVNCIITDYGDIHFSLDENQLANVMSFITYPIQKWKDKNTGELHMLMFITEELCHHFWNIEDEVEVNYKVLEVIQRIVPKTQMSDLYSMEWMESEKQKKKD